MKDWRHEFFQKRAEILQEQEKAIAHVKVAAAKADTAYLELMREEQIAEERIWQKLSAQADRQQSEEQTQSLSFDQAMIQWGNFFGVQFTPFARLVYQFEPGSAEKSDPVSPENYFHEVFGLIEKKKYESAKKKTDIQTENLEIH